MDAHTHNHDKIKFLVELGDGTYEDIVGYTDLCDLVEHQNQTETEKEDQLYTFKAIKNHHGPLKRSDPDQTTTWRSNGLTVPQHMSPST